MAMRVKGGNAFRGRGCGTNLHAVVANDRTAAPRRNNFQFTVQPLAPKNDDRLGANRGLAIGVEESAACPHGIRPVFR
jgi:hypothetical protein